MILLPLLIAVHAHAVPASPDAAADKRDSHALTELAQVTIEQRVIIRVPVVRRPPPPPGMEERAGAPPRVRWEEHGGPRCVAVRALRAAMVTSDRGVDLIMQDGKRMRARLGRECRPADLYSGFYIQPRSDGMLCADRDALLARSGANCPVDTFRRLSAERP